jgi:hypothetical protein
MMNVPYSNDEDLVPEEFNADGIPQGMAALNDLLMIHHGFTSATDLLESRGAQAPLLTPLLSGDGLGFIRPPGLAFGHNYFPMNHAFLKSIPLGWRRYEYQHQRLSPDNAETALCRDAGYLYNSVTVPVNFKEKKTFESYSAFFFRFKPFATDGELGVATLRLSNNLRLTLEMIPYSLAPGAVAPQPTPEGVTVETGLWNSWGVWLYCRVFTLHPLAKPPTPPLYLPPERIPLINRPDRSANLVWSPPYKPAQERKRYSLRWGDVEQRSDLNFLYEGGGDYLVELGLYTRVETTAFEQGRREHGLLFASRALIDSLRVQTLKYR